MSQLTVADKRQLLNAFRKRNQEQQQIICYITGMNFAITADSMPASLTAQHLCFAGLSPFANFETAKRFALISYKEAQLLSSSTLSGIFLSLSYHLRLRDDKLSATEANLILSAAPTFLLWKASAFLAKLSAKEQALVPSFSLTESDASTLDAWLYAAHSALDIVEQQRAPSLTPYKAKKTEKTEVIVSSADASIKAEAKQLLHSLQADGILSSTLQTVIALNLRGNALQTMEEALRTKIISALTVLGTADCLALASIFQKTGSALTTQERIISKQITALDNASDSFSTEEHGTPKKLSLAEILAAKAAKVAKAVEAVEATETLTPVEAFIQDLKAAEAIVEAEETEETEEAEVPEAADLDYTELDIETLTFGSEEGSDEEVTG